MTEYAILFYDRMVPDFTVEELQEKAAAARAVIQEMTDAGVFVFTGGLDNAAPIFGVDATGGTPVFTDGPLVEAKEYFGGICVVNVADQAEARMWAGKVAVACGWPQQVHQFHPRFRFDQSDAPLVEVAK